MRRVFRGHGLSIVLALLLAAHLVVYVAAAWPDWSSEHPHGRVVPGFLWYVTSQWLVSIAAEPLGALYVVLLTKWFREQGSDTGG